MSGDVGPRVCVPGALAVLRSEPSLDLKLVGLPDQIGPLLAGLDPALRERIDIVAATQVAQQPCLGMLGIGGQFAQARVGATK